MSGILIVSGRPRPARLTATVKDAVPPPPRELPRLNPVIPGTLVAVTLGIVYFSGLIQVDVKPAPQSARGPDAPGPPTRAKAVVKRAPDKLYEKPFALDERPGIVGQVRRLSFLVKKEPTNPSTFQERLAALRAFFAILTPVDRLALFETVEFSAVETALQNADQKVVFATLDRLFMRLQAAFH